MNAKATGAVISLLILAVVLVLTDSDDYVEHDCDSHLGARADKLYTEGGGGRHG